MGKTKNSQPSNRGAKQPLRGALSKLLLCGRSEGDRDSGLFGLSLNAQNLLGPVSFLIDLHAFVELLSSVAEHTADEPGHHGRHGGDGFPCAQTGSHAPAIGSQAGFAPPQSGSGHAQGSGGTVLNM
jgi:hypothetical protein